jgi:ribonuclease D
MMSDPSPDDADLAADVETPLLREPADGVPEPITTTAEITAVAQQLADASGPVALDAERASGYRYSQRAYLVQLRREGAGTVLIDPIGSPDVTPVNDALVGSEWILHAANQDLPCLAELGLYPSRLFDTELAGRLLGEERVALGTMVEQHLGVRLEKGHSAADWSTRPLPHDWLVYAALDVELLIPLREVLAEQLEKAGKSDWAEQEFEWVRTAPPPPPREEPWRRTSGIHALRNRRQLGALRALWTARDQLAASRDIAPGRVLPDSAIISAVRADPKTTAELSALPVFGGPRQRQQVQRWFGALAEGRSLPESELPATTGRSDAIPPPARWRERDPAAADRLARCRAVVATLAEEHTVLAQNLLASDVIRRLAWQPLQPVGPEVVAEQLATLGARPWQIGLTAVPLAGALSSAD